MVHKCLLTLDGSAPSLAAALMGADYARSQNAGLVVLTVLEPYAYSGVGAASDAGRQASSTAQLAPLQPQRETLRAHCQAHGQSLHEATVESTHPAQAIVESARSLDCDLIVMGSRGLGSLGALMMGSVAQKVLSHAPVRVMVIKA
jgi:nucleotide-binding universal stress UspA family protein